MEKNKIKIKEATKIKKKTTYWRCSNCKHEWPPNKRTRKGSRKTIQCPKCHCEFNNWK